jgi:DtxR family Mn-dependent transcriptional regulator
MINKSEEEYLGAIYRLRMSSTKPLPLSRLSSHFKYSPVSVHEMVQKLVKQDCVDYHKYYGVTLTQKGEEIAKSLLRKHRLWERFLTDVLNISWDDAHEIACSLEHASTSLVTEKLADFLGNPDSCPHGGSIPPGYKNFDDLCLMKIPLGSKAKITRISPETPGLLHRVRDLDLLPGIMVSVINQGDKYTQVACDDRVVNIAARDAQRIWAEVL